MKSCCKDVYDTVPVEKVQKLPAFIKWLRKLAGSKQPKKVIS